MKKILLIGIRGVYNYGCEAIVRGTVAILKKQSPDIKISYASYNYEYDSKALENCDITIIKRNAPRKLSGKNILRKLLSYIKIELQIPYDDIKFVQKGKFDAVFSIGGDMYTLNSKGNFNRTLPMFLENCQKLGLKYVLFGASVGPFDNNPKALEFYSRHLKKIDLILAREKHTVNYLKKIGITNNVKFAPDPAFFVAPELKKTEFRKETLKIGINLSPLSSLYYYPTLEIAAIKLADVIEELINETNSDIVFIPHVFSKHLADDDRSFLQKIKNNISEKNNSRVTLINKDTGFIQTKQYLIQCDLVVAARMHCAVNAVAANVPTIFISYSQKAKGMAELINSENKNIITLKDLEDTKKMIALLRDYSYKSNVEKLQDFDFRLLGKIIA